MMNVITMVQTAEAIANEVYGPTKYNNSPGYNIGKWLGSYFGFDCCGLIKSILWGFDGSKSAATYGGAIYCSNGVPDIDDQGFHDMCNCKAIGNDISVIPVGALLWKQGHVGIYCGNGETVEATTNGKSCVQRGTVGPNGVRTVSGYTNCGPWEKWGIIPYVTYSSVPDAEVTITGKFIEALKEFGDGRYSYYNERTGTGIGCSNYAVFALRRAGWITSSESFHAGSGVIGVLADTKRFKKIAWDPTVLKKGDILWSHGYHVAVWDGTDGVYEAAPEATHSLADCGTGVGHHSHHGYYNCGTGTKTWTCIYRIIEEKGGDTPVAHYSIDNLAVHIMRGEFGNGDERINKLKALGYSGEEITKAQEIINTVYARKEMDDKCRAIAMDMISGAYGDGAARKAAVTEKFGEDYYKLAQSKVNSFLA